MLSDRLRLKRSRKGSEHTASRAPSTTRREPMSSYIRPHILDSIESGVSLSMPSWREPGTFTNPNGVSVNAFNGSVLARATRNQL